MPGRHAASSDLPAPGGPLISRLCPPAAAISSARLATSWPLTCARSGPPTGGSASPRRGGASSAVPAQMVEQREQVGRGDDFELARPGRLAPCAAGQIRPLSMRRGVDRGEQHARRRRDPPVEAQLADRDIMRQRLRHRSPHRRKQAERDRQIVMRALLGQVGRRQVDRDPLGRQREADRGKRRMHPLAALRHRLVGKADDGEFRHARGELHLHLDRARLEPQISDSGDGRGHQATPSRYAILDRRPPSSARATLDRCAPSAASGLREPYCITTSPRMISRDQWRRFMDHPVVEWGLFVLGVLLLIVSPLVGVIPGPGGIVFAGRRPRADPQDQHVGEAALCAGQALAAQGRPVDRTGRCGATSATPRSRSAAQDAEAARGMPAIDFAAALHYRRRPTAAASLRRPFFIRL